MNARVGERRLGRLCVRGHDFEGTGMSLRRHDGDCVECQRESAKAFRKREAQGLAGTREKRCHRRSSLPVVRDPVVRSACPTARPCPRPQCRLHLGDVGDAHVDMTHSCALDLAEAGPLTLQEVGNAMGVSRERVRQLEEMAIAKIRRRAPELADYLSTVDPQPRARGGR